MASLVERLRARSEKRPLYEDDSEDDFIAKKRASGGNQTAAGSSSSEKIERFVREDAEEGACHVCGKDGDLAECKTCTYTYHLECLLPPLRYAPANSWSCSECVCTLTEIEKILDHEVATAKVEGDDTSKKNPKKTTCKKYLVKWKGLSYLHCSWISEMEFIKAFKTHARLKSRINNFNRQMESNYDSDDEWIAIRPEWTTVDRILARRKKGDEKEYFVKWKDLGYEDCSWELESDISTFQPQIEKFRKILSSAPKSSGKLKVSNDGANDLKNKQKEFQQYSETPSFLEGSLHPYQLEGLNFLRYSWSKKTHVILADEMGLGKTIQSIAFLASLFVENKNLKPHLVVAPLSTLRNWEREFATWAPHLNVIMYVGSATARSVIRQYEFYYPKDIPKKRKRKHTIHGNIEKIKNIKFDVLLTSYEMINMDSTSLKPIKWQCMIVDEGHRLKNKDSKLFIQLKLYSTKQRILLTGTPLQNNLDELFMLMHFLDAGKFSSLEDFQEEFKDINQEEQVSRLHKMLATHLLRRVKKDVMKDLPPKKELILRVELSSKQKEYYKAILTRNYEILARRGGSQISLINVVMELRKLCCHTYMLSGVEPEEPPEDENEGLRVLLEFSGKMLLLDKMMIKLKEQGHRVLIYSQFQHMLDLLEDYMNYKKWSYERIDGKISGAERQIRIDRYNAENSTRFCFLLSTRAGGLGINLATADTVIIYDSDWNPHADLQAMARAHRLGQTNKVMIYRLITRDTIEERIIQITKKKMVLEHLVVGRLKSTKNVNQEELDDIIRYGSKELFADENDEAGKSRQIHYDDAAIDRLLNREQIEAELSSIDEEGESDFLKAFKVANFEYVDEAEVEAVLEEEARLKAIPDKGGNANRMDYWDELLKDKYKELKVDEFMSFGKGKRSRKPMMASEEDELCGHKEESSDDDYSYEDDTSDGETGKRTQNPKKRGRVENMEPLPLIDGEGKVFRVLGFNRSQRFAFLKLLMRFGLGDFCWNEFVSALKGKSLEEIKQYAMLFLSHVIEEPTDSPNFLDGVPKEGLRTSDVLVRISTLQLIRDKLRFVKDNHGTSLFSEQFLTRFPMVHGKFWKLEHDILLLEAMLKHGYAKWQAIAEDKHFGIAEIVRQELNLNSIPSSCELFNSTGNDFVPPSEEATRETQLQSQLQLREMQRRVVEYVKRRVLLLERNINAEEYLKQNPHLTYDPREILSNDLAARRDIPIDGLPVLEKIAKENFPCGENVEDRIKMAQLYNKMVQVVEDNKEDVIMEPSLDKCISERLKKNLQPLEVICEDVRRSLAELEPQTSFRTCLLSKPPSNGGASAVPLTVECKEQKMPIDIDDN